MYFPPANGGGELRNVVIVAGHAIFRSGDPVADDNWVLLPFQKGEPPKYIEHIRAGVELTAKDPSALLVYSGGQSRREAGPRSEAQSYFWIADHYRWWGLRTVATRAITEEFARDSFENLLFGICRFRECTGRFPSHVTFVSWTFKQRRFELHREAIRWPLDQFHYAGVNNPDAVDQALAAEAYTTRGYIADPYSGLPEFAAKRDSRNPFLRQHGYYTSCPELTDLFRHKGPELFSRPLPWSAS